MCPAIRFAGHVRRMLHNLAPVLCVASHMSLAVLFSLAAAVLFTSFVSGVFGMAGGMMLMAIMLAMVPVGTAMVLHGVAQLTSNAWRAWLWRTYVDWRVVRRYLAGLALAVGSMGLVAFAPDRGMVLIALGVLPFLVLALPDRLVPQVDRPYGAQLCGVFNGLVNLLAGVSGPLLDVFFVRSDMDRRTVVATKAACQSFAHATKLVYFGALFNVWQQSALSPWILAACVVLAAIGTTCSRAVLDRLGDASFRRWTRVIVMAIGLVCLAQGIAHYWFQG
jgi:uncharacterized membrane protein YfcA